MTPLELLAPARDLPTAIAAIDCGADAVYIGATHHGARASASNSVADIKALCDYSHRYLVKVYVTLNTIIYDSELEDVRTLVWDLYRAGVDALIVQDMALLEMDLPPIPLHASTQCDIRTPAKARFLQAAGFEQLVLPREMSLEEIRQVRRVTDVPLEGFVHGALCVCYSGDCRASFVGGGRSANRGECAQVCRLPYNLVDGNGQTVMAGRHLLSLKDMNRLGMIAGMVDAGITSFKIEGRLKSADYVRNVVAAYSEALNDFISSNPEKYCRASVGRSAPGFAPNVNKAFNRGFTSYFLNDTEPQQGELSSSRTPKHIGESVAQVVRCFDGRIKFRSIGNHKIINGDGLGYFDAKGRFVGFRANKVEGDTIFLTADKKVAYSSPGQGAILYRNFDKAFSASLLSGRDKRTIGVRAILEQMSGGIKLTVVDERNCRVTVALSISPDCAKTPQRKSRERVLRKTGETIYSVTEVTDHVPEEVFIPASQLTDLRRRTFLALDRAAAATYPLQLSRRRLDPSAKEADNFYQSAENVSNRLAEQFYKRHGVTEILPAIEVSKSLPRKEVRVMTTRYCLRRELGACLKSAQAGQLREPLTLTSVGERIPPLRLKFDCSQCRMHVYAKKGD